MKFNKKTSVARGMIQMDWELFDEDGSRYLYTGNREEQFFTYIKGKEIQPLTILPKQSDEEPLEQQLYRSIEHYKKKEQK